MMYYVDVEGTFGGCVAVEANSKEEASKRAVSGCECVEVYGLWDLKSLNVMREDEEV